MSSLKKKSSKSPAKAAEVAIVEELRCMVLFQGYNADLQTTDQFAAPNSILMNSADMRQCDLRSGSYVHLKVDADNPEEEDYLLLRVWPSKTLGNNMVTINRSWWPNFTAKTKEERIGLISTRFKDVRVVPCDKLRVLVMSNEQNLSTDILHSSVFIKYVRAYIFEIPILRRQMMGVLYRGRAIVIQFVGMQAEGDLSLSMGTDKRSNEDTRLTLAYKVIADTLLSITTTDESENENQDTSSNAEQTPLLAFGGYTEQLEYANNVLRLALGLHAITTPIQQALSRHSGKNADNMLSQLFKSPRGMLIHGPPGSGKTLLMHTLLSQNRNDDKISCVELSHDILLLPYVGDAEKAVLACFEEAHKKAPCVILMDDIDILCRSRTSNIATAVQKSIVSSLLAIIDGVVDSTSTKSQSQVFIMATSNKPQDIDAAMRRPGRLDVEVELTAPTAQQREGILDAILNAMMGSNSSSNKLTREGIRKVAQESHGFVGSDLLQVIKEAHVIISDRVMDNNSSKDFADLLSLAPLKDTMSSVDVTDTDLLRALSKVPPSALREVVAEIPSVKWTDVGGMQAVKSSLQEVVEWPLKYADLFSKLQLPPPQGVLLYGPPGCSKTLMAKALATESNMNFLAVRGPELLSKWLGESEKAVQLLFKRARAAAPSIVFFDEIDALAGKRGTSNMGVNDRVLAQLLTELDGIASKSHSSSTMTAKRVIVVAATNRPDMLDDALLRPGRIDRKVFVPPPDAESREQIFSIELNKLPVQKGIDKLIPSLVTSSEGFSGAEVVAICKEAAMFAMEAGELEVKHDYLDKALKAIKPQITSDMLQFYQSLNFHK